MIRTESWDPNLWYVRGGGRTIEVRQTGEGWRLYWQEGMIELPLIPFNRRRKAIKAAKEVLGGWIADVQLGLFDRGFSPEDPDRLLSPVETAGRGKSASAGCNDGGSGKSGRDDGSDQTESKGNPAFAG